MTWLLSAVFLLIAGAATCDALYDYPMIRRPAATSKAGAQKAIDGPACDTLAVVPGCSELGPCMRCEKLSNESYSTGGKCAHAPEEECVCPEETPAASTWLSPCHQWRHRCPKAAVCRVAKCSARPTAVFYDVDWQPVAECGQMPVNPAREADKSMVCNELPLLELSKGDAQSAQCGDSEPTAFWYYVPQTRQCRRFETCAPRLRSLNAFESAEQCQSACGDFPPCPLLVPTDVGDGCEVSMFTDGQGCEQAYVNCTGAGVCSGNKCPPCHTCEPWAEGGFLCKPTNATECALEPTAESASVAPIPTLEQARKCREVHAEMPGGFDAAGRWHYDRNRGKCDSVAQGAYPETTFASQELCERECGAVRACPNVTRAFNIPVSGLCQMRDIRHGDGCVSKIETCLNVGCDSAKAKAACGGPCARCENVVVGGRVTSYRCSTDGQCEQYACATVQCGAHAQCVYDPAAANGTRCAPDALAQVACRRRPTERPDCPTAAANGTWWHYDPKLGACTPTPAKHCVARLGFPFSAEYGAAVAENRFASSEQCERRCAGTPLCAAPHLVPPFPGCYFLHSVDNHGCPTAEMICDGDFAQ